MHAYIYIYIYIYCNDINNSHNINSNHSNNNSNNSNNSNNRAAPPWGPRASRRPWAAPCYRFFEQTH